MTPDELVSCVLRAPVDLLWNGGIGTYVKASGAVARRRRRQGQRRRAGRRRRAALPGRGRGGQPRLHPAGTHRVRHGRRPHQHRRHRQLGRRRLLRPRGEHQGPARRDRGRGRPHREAARRADGRDDRRGRRPGPAGQLPAEPGHRQRIGPGGQHGRRPRPLPAVSGAGRQARPTPRVPPRPGGARRAPGRRQGPHRPRVRRAPRLHARSRCRTTSLRFGPPGGPVPGLRARALLPGSHASSGSPTGSAAIACAGRSSPPPWPTASSTGQAHRWSSGWRRRPEPPRPTSPEPTPPPARSSASPTSGTGSRPSTTGSRPTSRRPCCSRPAS